MRALLLSLIFAVALPPLLHSGAVRAETWACYDPRQPKAPPIFANGKKRGLRCVLFSASQKWPRGPEKKEPEGSDGAADAASHKDVGGGSERFAPPLPPTGGMADEPAQRDERESLYGPYVDEAARQYDLPEAFIKAIIRVESNYKYRAVSSVGAQGLMQLMPATGREMGVTDPWDPRQNILGGARLLRLLANRHRGDIVKVLSSYCSGSGAVQKKGGIPNEAAEGYVRAVLDFYYQYKALGP